MAIVFRVDASLEIGTGHVMRCLVLADSLRARGAECIFICRDNAGNLSDYIRSRGYELFLLPLANNFKFLQDGPAHAYWLGETWEVDANQTSNILRGLKIDWLVIDHYALDYRWEQVLHSFSARIMVIDDLSDRRHQCDLLLDQNLGRSRSDYKTLLGLRSRGLFGPEYALLRSEFGEMREYSLARRKKGEFKRLLISMGGVDRNNATGRVMSALNLCELAPDFYLTVVMGSTAPWVEHIQAQALNMSCKTDVLVGVENMSEILANCDLAIGAAGSSSWERCCLGLPAMQVVLAANQRLINIALAQAGAVLALDIEQCLEQLPVQLKRMSDSNNLLAMSNAAQALCDGGGAERVADIMLKESYEDNSSM